MAWIVCLICGLAGACLAIFLGDWLTGLYRMSNFEGGRGYFIAFALTPLGFLSGLAIGIVAVWRISASGFEGYARLLGIALLIIGAVSGVIALMGVALADHPPRINGHKLLLQYELRLPKTAGPVNPPVAGPPGAGLREGSYDIRSANLQPGYARPDEDGTVVIPGEVDLLAPSASRSLQGDFPLSDGRYQQYAFDLALPAAPTAADQAWSGWTVAPAGEATGTAGLPAEQRPALRYRVRTMP